FPFREAGCHRIDASSGSFLRRLLLLLRRALASPPAIKFGESQHPLRLSSSPPFVKSVADPTASMANSGEIHHTLHQFHDFSLFW
ncbi:unnamed protein product, partial [Arabidopsis halleri]